MPSRNWRAAIIVGCTLLLTLPLYQLRDHQATGYYKQYLYDHLSPYLQGQGVYNNTLYHEGTEAAVHSSWNFSSPCAGFPNMDGIMLVMKTGATEAYDKLPTQLLTGLQCIDDFLLFSDLEQQIGKYHIYDSLDRVDDKIKEKYKEFKLYQAQQECPVSQKDCTAGMDGGWELDKFKFVNMIVRAWELRPNQEWYVFAEADTYVVWPTLVHWLRNKVNPRDNVYIGSVAMISGFPFAHGGSGYIVSGALMRKMAQIPDITKYDDKAGDECCGDVVFSRVAKEVGTKVLNAHPMFNGEKPNTLPYGPGHWCEPLFTMHHVNSEEISSVWQYEQTRTKQVGTPYDFMQIREMYYAFFAPKMVSFRKDWDNLSDDTCYIAPDEESQKKATQQQRDRQVKEGDKNVVQKYAHNSPAACAKVCEAADRKCFQWRFQKNVCCTAKSFKLGKPKKEKNDGDKWTSGWFVRGINDWIETKGECPVEWKNPR
ncbi:glycosyltransferase family 31 protein [Trichoderma virens Gv29-8]|uniref:N-acetylgalactosaminide beta-1,3-galactosyltransferase n=1 Tax=Hypocrea virens (strain Gv29-8 / FGSC 10586) TaxID=413071 RepID=G9MDJ4_HYPVG|nr:glycosyltransferase family 31 protein [Trichoderma virens Gv29-8]EHK27156.1 glycosyltransferase family 31 protein [Trichoderma virens Gv29-8]